MIRRLGVFAALIAMGALAGCGSDKEPTLGGKLAGEAIKLVASSRRAATAPKAAITRAELAQFKTPMIMAEVPALGFYTFVVPYGQNGGIETWASTDDKTVSFRDGMVVGTRGFGGDLMQAQTPTIAQIASGSGTHPRIYYFSDGADRTLRYEMSCTLQNLGSTKITVVERQHTVRHVKETCTGKLPEFANDYWFENGNFLRKSSQLLNPSWGPLVLSRVVDKG
jgi:Group 4 capsule polysaccharide lipoprotein gfcB, YjbF